jgi:hypothetical protein
MNESSGSATLLPKFQEAMLGERLASAPQVPHYVRYAPTGRSRDITPSRRPNDRGEAMWLVRNGTCEFDKSSIVDGPRRDRASTRHPSFFGAGPELFDLVQGEGVHVGAGLPGAVPADEEFERLLEIELRGPSEVCVGAAGV